MSSSPSEPSSSSPPPSTAPPPPPPPHSSPPTTASPADSGTTAKADAGVAPVERRPSRTFPLTRTGKAPSVSSPPLVNSAHAFSSPAGPSSPSAMSPMSSPSLFTSAPAFASSSTPSSPCLLQKSSARPSLIPRASQRPSYISMPSSVDIPLVESADEGNVDAVTSPSVSVEGSTASSRFTNNDRSSRVFPMRSVMYPSNASVASGGRRGGGSVVSNTHSSTSASSAASATPLTGPASRAEASVGGAPSLQSSREEAEVGEAAPVAKPEHLTREGLERAAAGLGNYQQPRAQPLYDDAQSAIDLTPSEIAQIAPYRRRRSRVGEQVGSGGSKTSRGDVSRVASDQKPRSLYDFLEEPTTHAKIGDPEPEDDGGEGPSETSNVQVQDFAPSPEEEAEEYEARRRKPHIEGALTESTAKTSSSDMPLLMTSRFEHQTGEDGEVLVLTGREGELEKCEDEPIHAPGAIQAFGVLLAFDVEEDGRMTVQQVSENSGFILGLPPRHLFRCECFTDILEDDEIDALEDALEALDDRDLDPDNDEVGPHTFTLSGYGLPGSGGGDAQSGERGHWTCHAAIHRPSRETQPKRVVLELELVDDQFNPIYTHSSEPPTPDEDERVGFAADADYGEGGINPTQSELLESTVSIVRPLRTLARIKEKQRRKGRKSTRGLGEMDVLGLLGQINDQMGKAEDLETFLKVTAGVFRELTEFDRVMIYQFDEAWNGCVVAEQVDYTRSKDLFRGLNFPASDIPSQARELYKINKVRLLYDRDQPSARICCRNVAEVDTPLDMTHAHLRAMSPIHIKYLGNMGVRSSMSISITAFGDLWGLVSMHTYGRYGRRVSFPVRQLCKLLGQSISRNIERISYSRRLQARKLINTSTTEANPSGYIIAKAEDLLDLFAADFGCLSIGDEAKILGSVSNSQELLAVLEYLRIQRFTEMKATQDITADFPDIEYPGGFELISGMLFVPLSAEGSDFIVFFRKGQLQNVRWAGNPYANKTSGDDYKPLEPRKSFAVWSETVVGKSLAWTDEEKETAGVLCLVYGKFIAVWREKESALASSQLTNLLLQNASHEVRTPLNAIINYLELALDGPMEGEVRENLQRSHTASKSLIHVINDLLDLTRTEKGQDLYLTDPFNIADTINDALGVHREEAKRRGIELSVVEQPTGTPPVLLGDRAKLRQVITNVVANAVKHTKEGSVSIEWGEAVDVDLEDAFEEKADSIRIGISVTDTGVGISEEKLESIFRQFEQVSTIGDKERDEAVEQGTKSVGLGLAVVARVVRNLGGQLQVESKVGEGSKFSFTFPFRLPPTAAGAGPSDTEGSTGTSSRTISNDAAMEPLARSRSTGSGGSLGSNHSSGRGSGRSDINGLISAMASSGPGMGGNSGAVTRRQGGASSASSRSSASLSNSASARSFRTAQSSLGSAGAAMQQQQRNSQAGGVEVSGNRQPLRAARMSENDSPMNSPNNLAHSSGTSPFFVNTTVSSPSSFKERQKIASPPPLRRSSTSTTIGSGSSVMTPSSHPASPGFAAGLGNSQADEGATPRASSPTSMPFMKHIADYKKKSAAEPDDHITPMRVLVVEDEMVNRMIISKRLKMDGHEVVVAEHGAVAIRKFEEDRDFDIILMDLQMPIMGGLDASLGIRQIEKDKPLPPSAQRPSTLLNRSVPIIAVTASLPERDRNTIIDAKLNGWLLKPIDFKRLQVLMKGALDPKIRNAEVYRPGKWEAGGWNNKAPKSKPSRSIQSDQSSEQSGQTLDAGLASLTLAASRELPRPTFP